jgi:hypothetical protein
MVPFGSGNEQWNGVEIPGPFRAERIAVYVVGDAIFADALTGGLPVT